jgi:hypothetical protein
MATQAALLHCPPPLCRGVRSTRPRKLRTTRPRATAAADAAADVPASNLREGELHDILLEASSGASLDGHVGARARQRVVGTPTPWLLLLDLTVCSHCVSVPVHTRRLRTIAPGAGARAGGRTLTHSTKHATTHPPS